MTRRLPALGLAALALACLASPAAAHARDATLRAHHVATVEGDGARLAIDGERYAVYGKQGGPWTVLDTPTGTSRELPLDPTCFVTDAAHGTAVARCGDDTRVVDLVSGEARTVATFRRVEGGGCCAYSEMGRHWLEGGGYDAGANKPVTSFLNWRTGEERRYYDPGNVDLDSPGYREHRPPEIDRDPPFRLLLHDGENRTRLHVTRSDRRGFRRHLSWCRTLCARAELASRMATWVQGGAPYAYDLRTARRYRVVFDGRFDRDSSPLRATRTHLVVGGVEHLGGARTRVEVHVARRPR